jgi:hypothetical protein
MEERRLYIGGQWDLKEFDGGSFGCRVILPGGWGYKYAGRAEHDGMLTHIYVYEG